MLSLRVRGDAVLKLDSRNLKAKLCVVIGAMLYTTELYLRWVCCSSQASLEVAD